jgi:aryl-alcohol dehydrogenase-like predicted oxidoreductase
MPIERIPFGRTGHESTRTLFGAAALGAMRQERADKVIETVRAQGVNHFDTAASYGDAELRLAPFLREHRDQVFLATKTGERTREGARDQLQRSLERLGVEHVDLIQLHNLVDPAEQETALGAGGALEALVEARERGQVRFIGVTGHGTRVAQAHLKSLERFDFDSVLLPYNFSLVRDPVYAADFETLLSLCAERNVAVQTIKAVARRRWREGDPAPHYSWYEPIRDPEGLRRAVHFVLARPRLFLNTSSDATLLAAILEAAAETNGAPGDADLAHDLDRLEIEPLFIRGISDTI